MSVHYASYFVGKKTTRTSSKCKELQLFRPDRRRRVTTARQRLRGWLDAQAQQRKSLCCGSATPCRSNLPISC